MSKRVKSTSQASGKNPPTTNKMSTSQHAKVASRKTTSSTSKGAVNSRQTPDQVRKSQQVKPKERVHRSSREQPSLPSPVPAPDLNPVPITEIENEYSDDFENYESDFEDDMEEELDLKDEVEDVDEKKDVNARENVKVEVPKSSSHVVWDVGVPKKPPEEPLKVQKTVLKPVTAPPEVRTTHFDFQSAKQQLINIKAGRITRKRWDYLKDVVTLETVYTNHFSQPPIRYDLFMSLFGMDHNTQSCVQTGDDDVEQECETEKVETEDRWTQFPLHINCEPASPGLKEELKSRVKDWNRLVRFVRSSSRLICGLLEESVEVCATKTVVLEPLSCVHSCSVVHVSSAARQPFQVLVSYRRKKSSSRPNREFLLLWDIRWPSRPQRLLTCYSQPVCCCLDSDAKFGCAGMVDGSVAVWDLEEYDSTRSRIMCGKEDWELRGPSYSTAEVLKENGHGSSVRAIRCVEESSGVTQVISLEEEAVFHVWIIGVSSCDEDLGTSPQSRIRLLKASTINLQDQGFSRLGARVTTYVIHPQNSSSLLAATDAGIVCSVSHILNKRQRQFKHYLDLPVRVVALSFTPDGQYFLAGFDDSTVQLFSLLKEKPVEIWHLEGDLVSVCCSQTTFFALTATGEIQLWKFADDEKTVVKRSPSKRKPVFIDVIGNGRSQLVIGSESGIVEINNLVKNL